MDAYQTAGRPASWQKGKGMTIDGQQLLLRVEMWCARYWAEAMVSHGLLGDILEHVRLEDQETMALILSLMIAEDFDLIGYRRAWKQVRTLRETGQKIEFIEERSR